ncbi:hypothetical protein SAMN04488069_1354 [Hymenobacter psychrophilus]|uniref:Uncharacterized protein n=1 Tax=Hymenobacter psychrophilus TaxID=651662 RepID=A0A1H3PJ63_9BACT|nr:hypothetical protein SAMN04488069_1354 [Hymenobacter psychrophilus]
MTNQTIKTVALANKLFAGCKPMPAANYAALNAALRASAKPTSSIPGML